MIFFSTSCTPNKRVYVKGNIRAIGSIASKSDIKYYSISIGTHQIPLDVSKVPFSIRFNDKKMLTVHKMTLQNIMSLSPSKNTNLTGWNADAIEYSIEGYSFIFLENKLIHFKASFIQLPKKTFIPEIGNNKGESFFSLPISQQNLENLFGEPDKYEDTVVL